MSGGDYRVKRIDPDRDARAQNDIRLCVPVLKDAVPVQRLNSE
jgi:hypothetical protein